MFVPALDVVIVAFDSQNSLGTLGITVNEADYIEPFTELPTQSLTPDIVKNHRQLTVQVASSTLYQLSFNLLC